MNFSCVARCNSAITGGMPESSFASRGQPSIVPDSATKPEIGELQQFVHALGLHPSGDAPPVVGRRNSSSYHSAQNRTWVSAGPSSTIFVGPILGG